MARRTQTDAVRLAVEGGGQVKAELVSVGQSGEQSLKRIESAGDRASGGLKGLGRQAELLRTGIRTLGGASIRPGVQRHGGCPRGHGQARVPELRRQHSCRHQPDRGAADDHGAGGGLLENALGNIGTLLGGGASGAGSTSGGGLFGLFHEGGIAGERPPAVR